LTQKAAIPSVFLFGEPLRTVEGKFLHLEVLDDRTRPNDWIVRAHATSCSPCRAGRPWWPWRGN